jgi:hypothetical protein
LNDLEDFLENHNVTGLLTISQDIENIMNVYINIFLLLYADDTSISLLLYVNCKFCGNLPFVKHTILVLSIFTFNFQAKQ